MYTKNKAANKPLLSTALEREKIVKG